MKMDKDQHNIAGGKAPERKAERLCRKLRQKKEEI